MDGAEETGLLKQQMLAMYQFYKDSGMDISDMSVWDLFTAVVPESDAKMTMLLKADLPVLELLVEGQTPGQVARTLGISQAAVSQVADLWNINVTLKALDINPLLVYNDGMGEKQFVEEFSDSSLYDHSNKDLIGYYENVLTYRGLLEFLDEVEE